MTRYFLLAIIALTLIASGIYAYLGGFRAPTVTLETTATPMLLAGQPFRGPASSEAFAKLFRQASEAQAHNRPKGDLANIFFNSPEKARDTVQAFVGLAVANTLQPLPAGWRYRYVAPGQRIVAARLRGTSYLLAPGKLYPAALERVQQQKLTPRNFYLERFGANDQSEVWVGVK